MADLYVCKECGCTDHDHYKKCSSWYDKKEQQIIWAINGLSSSDHLQVKSLFQKHAPDLLKKLKEETVDSESG